MNLHHQQGFLRVAAAVPVLKLADCATNAARTIAMLRQAEEQAVDLVVFPECNLTGYTCGDLFHQPTLQRAAEEALRSVLVATAQDYRGIAIVGLPVALDGMVFNAAAVLHQGTVLGLVTKTYLPNYKEFYDARYFHSGSHLISDRITIAGLNVPIGTQHLFVSTNIPDFRLGVEICEDLWMPIPPSSVQATRGATVIANLSASNETIGKAAYRRQLVAGQSGRCLAGYVYASSGVGESSTDLVFGGHALIAENGSILAESPRFQRENQLVVADLDLSRLIHDRQTTTSFHGQSDKSIFVSDIINIGFESATREQPSTLARFIDPHPFVPSDSATLRERCEEIFLTQVSALARRLDQTGSATLAIGVSGGLDSTLSLLVACKTLDLLGKPRTLLQALTMPGFGTTRRTRGNAHALMTGLGVSPREIDIRTLCFEQMRALGHSPFGISLEQETLASLEEKLRHLPAERRHDLVFENIQARVRTSLLMNTGFVIGTGDLSELALGWCTYNADHMSMYNPNASIPKTLVKFLVKWAAENEFTGEVRSTLLDIVDTEISPELLPTAADGSMQSTEGTIGPYELHDFFLYHFLRWGSSPDKILFLANHAKFDRSYSTEEVRRWLIVFLKRFFASQYKRSCVPDGPKVGSVSLSPRGDWRMPSDAVAESWLKRLE